MAIVTSLLIWSSIDPYMSDLDLMLGDLWHTRMALWGTIVISIVVLLQELPKEMNSKFHLILLSKPISRYGYLLGKLLGIFGFSMIVLTVLLLVSYFSASLQCEEAVPVIENLALPWLHYALYLWLFSLVSVVSGAFLNEAFCLMVLAVFLSGSYVIGMLSTFREGGDLGLVASLSLKFIYHGLPNFQYFGPSHYETYGVFAPFYLLVYVAGYTGLLLPFALKKFEEISFH
jgi:ABC-type Na+ efflux pump permease subunit